MRRCERAGCSEPPVLVLSVDVNGRVIYWDPVPLARRRGAGLCFVHATEVAVPNDWVICDRRGRSTVIHVPPVEWETLVAGRGPVGVARAEPRVGAVASPAFDDGLQASGAAWWAHGDTREPAAAESVPSGPLLRRAFGGPRTD